MDGGGLEDIAGPLVHVVEHACIAPDFGIKSAAAGVENSHDLPMTASKINHVAEGQTRIAAAGVFAHDQLGKARLEHSTLNDLNVSANGQNVGGDAANLSVGIGPGSAQGKGCNHHYFRGHQRGIRGAGHAGIILENFDVFEFNSAHHLRGGAGAQDDGVVIRAGGDQGSPEAAGQRKHGHKNADGSGDTQDGDDGRRPASLDAAKVVDDRDSHLNPPERIDNPHAHGADSRKQSADAPTSRAVASPRERIEVTR